MGRVVPLVLWQRVQDAMKRIRLVPPALQVELSVAQIGSHVCLRVGESLIVGRAFGPVWSATIAAMKRILAASVLAAIAGTVAAAGQSKPGPLQGVWQTVEITIGGANPRT